jgi:hypothetical protein
LNMTTPMND